MKEMIERRRKLLRALGFDLLAIADVSTAGRIAVFRRLLTIGQEALEAQAIEFKLFATEHPDKLTMLLPEETRRRLRQIKPKATG